MKRRSFIKSAMTTAIGLGLTGRSSAYAEEVKSASTAKRTLGKTGFQVFPVVYGGIVSMNDGQEASNNYINWAIDRGVNYFDVAPLYGDAQEKLGHSLKNHRKKVYLACKSV